MHQRSRHARAPRLDLGPSRLDVIEKHQDAVQRSTAVILEQRVVVVGHDHGTRLEHVVVVMRRATVRKRAGTVQRGRLDVQRCEPTRCEPPMPGIEPIEAHSAGVVEEEPRKPGSFLGPSVVGQLVDAELRENRRVQLVLESARLRKASFRDQVCTAGGRANQTADE